MATDDDRVPEICEALNAAILSLHSEKLTDGEILVALITLVADVLITSSETPEQLAIGTKCVIGLLEQSVKNPPQSH